MLMFMLMLMLMSQCKPSFTVTPVTKISSTVIAIVITTIAFVLFLKKIFGWNKNVNFIPL